MRKKYTDEQRAQVVQMYLEGKSVSEIASEAGIPSGSMSGILRAAGVKQGRYTPRNERIVQKEVKKCHLCHSQNEEYFNFCWNCGADLRSEEDLLLDEVRALRSFIVHLPGDMASKADCITQNLISYLKGRKQ